jgi:hypothetical protein
MKNIKNKLFVPVILIAVIIAGIMLFNTDLENIEDTNGADNFELQTITDEDIAKIEMGSLNVGVSTNNITNMTEISSSKFTGVYEVLYTNLIGKSDFLLNIYDFQINSGNFKMVVVHDGEIVHTITPENAEEFLLEDISGTVSLVIAGESADFSFEMAKFEYDSFSHK